MGAGGSPPSCVREAAGRWSDGRVGALGVWRGHLQAQLTSVEDINGWEFIGGPVVGILCSTAGGTGLIPGGETKILHASQ